MADDWKDEPAARDPVPPGHGEPQWMEDPDWDLVAEPGDPQLRLGEPQENER